MKLSVIICKQTHLITHETELMGGILAWRVMKVHMLILAHLPPPPPLLTPKLPENRVTLQNHSGKLSKTEGKVRGSMEAEVQWEIS